MLNIILAFLLYCAYADEALTVARPHGGGANASSRSSIFSEICFFFEAKKNGISSTFPVPLGYSPSTVRHRSAAAPARRAAILPARVRSMVASGGAAAQVCSGPVPW